MLNIHITPFPELVTDRLLLRRVTTADGKEIFLLRCDPEVNKYLDRVPAVSLEAALEHIQRVDDGIASQQALYWGICLKSDAVLVGTICLWNIVPAESTAEIGFELLPGFHRRGMMQEAVSAILRYAFDEAGFSKLIGWVHKRNHASIALLEKCKFKRDDVEETKIPEEALGDMLIYSVEICVHR